MNYRIFMLSIIVLSFILSSCNDQTTNPEPINYESVTIGTQVWMAKNLDVDHYRNGDPIPEVKDSTQWANLTTGAWCYYNNDPANGAIYGKLYNWYAINDPRGLAPKGWHVASDDEWTTLSAQLGGESVAGGKLKEIGTLHWYSPNEGATNETGFSALPSGCRNYNGSFFSIGFDSYLLSSTADGVVSACSWGRRLGCIFSGLARGDFDKGGGYAVRCVKDSKNSPPTINSITPISASIGAEIKLSGRSFGSTRGTSVVSFSGANVSEYKSWSDTEIKVKVPVGATTGKLSVTVDNQKSNEYYFTVATTLADEVTIGTQVWMSNNLDVDHYRNGDPIPQVTDSTEWKNLKTGAWCYYNNVANNGATYGKIYNWYAVNDSRGLAPVGWHIPTDAEWTTLSTYLGGESVAGGKLKEIGTIHWYIPNTDATNESGFTALPGGFRYDYGTFYGIEFQGYWWSSTEYGTSSAWARYLYYYYSEIHGGNCSKGHGFSVRCIKD